MRHRSVILYFAFAGYAGAVHDSSCVGPSDPHARSGGRLGPVPRAKFAFLKLA
jgi:hypothetical protein